MRRDEDIVHVLAGIHGGARFRAIGHLGKAVENLDAGLLQLPAYGDREKRTDYARHDGKDEVHGADVLVIGRIGIAAPAGRVMLGFAVIGISMCHFGPLSVAGGLSGPVHCLSLVAAPAAASARRAEGLSRPANISLASSTPAVLAFSTQALNSASGTARTVTGMKAWSLPQSSEHWP